MPLVASHPFFPKAFLKRKILQEGNFYLWRGGKQTHPEHMNLESLYVPQMMVVPWSAELYLLCLSVFTVSVFASAARVDSKSQEKCKRNKM